MLNNSILERKNILNVFNYQANFKKIAPKLRTVSTKLQKGINEKLT